MPFLRVGHLDGWPWPVTIISSRRGPLPLFPLLLPPPTLVLQPPPPPHSPWSQPTSTSLTLTASIDASSLLQNFPYPLLQTPAHFCRTAPATSTDASPLLQYVLQPTSTALKLRPFLHSIVLSPILQVHFSTTTPNFYSPQPKFYSLANPNSTGIEHLSPTATFPHPLPPPHPNTGPDDLPPTCWAREQYFSVPSYFLPETHGGQRGKYNRIHPARLGAMA